jgi:DNA-binding response OmpR family regulator
LRNSIRILIVEDDQVISDGLRNSIKKGLSELDRDIVIDQALTIKRANSLLSKFVYEICSLDVILPDGNGLDLVSIIRTSELNSNSKILMLTTEDDANTRIGSFEFGADDYIAKPFLPEEYVLRIKRLLNYKNIGGGRTLNISQSIKLSLKGGYIRIMGSRVNLTKTEIELIELLAQEKLCSSEMLLQKLGNSFSIESLRMLISRLRKKIKEQTGYTIIKTEVGKGYSLAEF